MAKLFCTLNVIVIEARTRLNQMGVRKYVLQMISDEWQRELKNGNGKTNKETETEGGGVEKVEFK